LLKSTKIFIFLFWCLTALQLEAQLDTVHYIPPMHGRGWATAGAAINQHWLYITTPKVNPFNVTVRTGGGAIIATGTVSNANPFRVLLGSDSTSFVSVGFNELNTPISNKGIVVVADDSIYVNYRLAIRGNQLDQANSVTAKGRPGLGTTFRIGAPPVGSTSTTNNRVSFFSFMAVQNNTVLTLSGFGPGMVCLNNGPTSAGGSYTLQAGESIVFSVRHNNGQNSNQYVGALVQSNRPVAMLNGFCLGNLPGFNSNQDAGYDQPVPVNRLGTEYITIRGNGTENTLEQVMIVAHYPNTQVFVNGSATPLVTLNAGQHVLINGSNYAPAPALHMYIQTSRPAYCYQHLAGAGTTSPPQRSTGGLSFIGPLTCRLPNSVNNIASIDSVGAYSFTGGLLVITRAVDSLIVSDLNGTNVYAPSTGNIVAANPFWKTYKIVGTSGTTSIVSSGPMALSFFGANSYAGMAGFFTGFDAPPTLDFTLTGDTCVNAAVISVGAGYDSYQWFHNSTLMTGATTNSITPTLPGDYYVVTDINGCIDSTSKIAPFEIFPYPDAQFSVNDICEAAQTPINNLTTIQNNYALNYLWQFGNGNSSTNANPAYVFPNPGNYTINLKVTGPGSCTDSIQQSLTVFPKPVSGFSFPDSCGFSHAILNSASIASPGTISQWIWDFGDSQGSSISAPSHTYSTHGLYQVSQIVVSTDGCSDTLVQPVQIWAQPSAAFTLPFSCDQTSLSFTDQSSIPSSQLISWQWNFGDGGSSSLQNPTYSYQSNGVFPVQLVVTGLGGCTDTLSNLNTVFPRPVANFSLPNDSCSLTAAFTDLSTIAGTASIVNWNWSFGDSGSSAVPSPTHTYAQAGSYPISLIVNSSDGCADTLQLSINKYPSPVLSLSQVNDVVCFGDSTGFVLTQLQSGTAPFTFNWNSGQVTSNLLNAPAGNYVLVASDFYGCTDTLTTQIIQPAAPVALALPSDSVLCFGQTNGALNLNVSGGTAPYSFLWNNGATTQNVNNLAVGSYSVVVTDDAGCKDSIQAVITGPPAPLALSSAVGNVDCFGNATGSIALSVSGGTAPYAYSWDNGAVTQNLNNVVSGSYTVLVTDTNGCTETLSATITQPAAGMTSSAVATDVNCFGDATGAIATTISGGTAPYSFAWSNSATTQDIANLIAGPYTLITTDQEGCTNTLNVQINQPAAPVALALPSDSVLCFGQTNGALNLNVSGGTAPYSSLWNNGATTQNVNNLAVGSYSVVVTDDAGCKDSIQAVITGPPAPLALSSAVGNVDCFGNATGSIALSVSGGTAPYAYSWDNGAVTQNLNNVVSGTYTVLVTDTNGCTESLSATITQPAAGMTSSAVATDVNCFGDATGAIVATISGGTAPYSFAWSNSATTQDIANLIAGPYTLITTDQEGCTNTLNVQINQPAAPLALALPSDSVLCFGQTNGALNLNVSGGTAPYSFLWNNGATTQNVNNLAVGSYSVVVTDDAGCKDSIQAVITGPPAPLALSSVVGNVDCFGNATGSIALSVSGGTAPYAYSWDNGAVTQNLNNVVSGTYTVLVTDTNGCTESLSATITQPAAPLQVTLSAIDVSCFGFSDGSVASLVSGGTAPYQYSWNSGQSSDSIGNLVSGTYSVIVTDTNLCTATDTIQVTQPADIIIVPIADIIVCPQLPVSGISFSTNYPAGNYSWTSSAPALGIGNSGADSIPGFISPVHTGPAPLVSQIIVTPSVGQCFGAADTFSITVNPSPDIIATPSFDSLCSGQLTTIQISSGVPGTQFSWIVSGALNSGAVAGNGSLIQQNLVNLSNQTDTVFYQLNAQAAGCPGTPVIVPVRIFPIPQLIPQPPQTAICDGQSLLFNLGSTVAGSSFAWTAWNGPGISGAVAGNGNQIQQALTNSGFTIEQAYYAVTPTANGCPGQEDTLWVDIFPTPDVFAVPGSTTLMQRRQHTNTIKLQRQRNNVFMDACPAAGSDWGRIWFRTKYCCSVDKQQPESRSNHLYHNSNRQWMPRPGFNLSGYRAAANIAHSYS
jgi:PKD repeat protein